MANTNNSDAYCFPDLGSLGSDDENLKSKSQLEKTPSLEEQLCEIRSQSHKKGRLHPAGVRQPFLRDELLVHRLGVDTHRSRISLPVAFAFVATVFEQPQYTVSL